MFKMAGQAKENLPGGSPKYLLVYLKVRIIAFRTFSPLGSPRAPCLRKSARGWVWTPLDAKTERI